MPAANDLHAQPGAVASQQAIGVLAVEQVLELLAVAPVQIDILKTEYIYFQVFQHRQDVALHVVVALVGQFGNLAGRHDLTGQIWGMLQS